LLNPFFERFDMNKKFLRAARSLTQGFALCALAFASLAAVAAPHHNGQTSHRSVSVNVGVHANSGHYRGGNHYYRGGYGRYYNGYYGGYYGRGWNRPYSWGGFYSGLSLGLVVPFLPLGYSTAWYGGSPYYYANDVYYVSQPGRGYRVVAAPDSQIISETYVYDVPGPTPVVAAPPVTYAPTPSYVQQAAPSQAQTQTQPQAQAQLYAYPNKGQTATQSTFDRIECERWGSGQTGYAPGQSVEDAKRKADYTRAVSACLEGRGYSVK
jgi:hypothetical protein